MDITHKSMGFFNSETRYCKNVLPKIVLPTGRSSVLLLYNCVPFVRDLVKFTIDIGMQMVKVTAGIREKIH